jgi:hypothetical protein
MINRRLPAYGSEDPMGRLGLRGLLRRNSCDLICETSVSSSAGPKPQCELSRCVGRTPGRLEDQL